MLRERLCSVLVLSLAAPALAGGTVTLRFDSSVDGAVVGPGDTIDWTISADVSEDNEGLAMIRVEIRPSILNPTTLLIPPADGVPSGMENFSSPQGISNHDGAGGSAYAGTQFGSLLFDIGGMQNTFNVAGTTIGKNPTVVANVGHNGQEIASGSFAAPAVEGAYTFSIANAMANVLDQINLPPEHSPVSPATIVYVKPDFTFNVSLDCPGDVDGDLDVDVNDLTIVLANFGDPGPDSPGDTDGDGDTDVNDLTIVLANFGASCP